jgi:hypothetical protein
MLVRMLAAAMELVDRKNKTVKARKLQEIRLESQLADLNEEGEVKAGCGMCTLLFGQRRKGDGPKVHGIKSGSASSSSRLEQAQASLRERAERLQERMTESRREAAAFMKLGKKTEALAAMKRAKVAEKQFLTASSAVDALDSQILALEEANLQQEIASALSASVKKVKKNTKGLLSRTEAAVDGSAEVKDLAEDVNSALEGLQPSNVPDEDELLEELQAMMVDGEIEAEEAAATAPTMPPQVELRSWPAAPKEQVIGTRKRTDGFQQLLPATS